MSTVITGTERMRTAQPAGRRSAIPGAPELSPEAARQNALDNAQFEKQAAEAAKPTATRPALIVEHEIEHLRATYTLGSSRLEMLTKVKNIREAAWQVLQGEEPLLLPNHADQAKAEEFFARHGTRLADAPRQAPPNPLKAKPDTAPAAAPVKAAPAVNANRPAAALQPAAPDPALAFLARIAKATEAQAAQITALAGEVKSLREQLATLPVATAGAAGLKEGESYQDFLMDSLKVGADENSGEPTYKAQGPAFKKYGVRVWPEILPELGLDEEELEFGVTKLPKPLKVRALVVDGKAKKVIGLAT